MMGTMKGQIVPEPLGLSKHVEGVMVSSRQVLSISHFSAQVKESDDLQPLSLTSECDRGSNFDAETRCCNFLLCRLAR